MGDDEERSQATWQAQSYFKRSFNLTWGGEDAVDNVEPLRVWQHHDPISAQKTACNLRCPLRPSPWSTRSRKSRSVQKFESRWDIRLGGGLCYVFTLRS